MKIPSVSFLVLLLLSATGSISAQVVNGDFEAGDFTGWTASGKVGVAAYQAVGGVGTWPEGTYVANFNAGDRTPDATISQTVATSVGQLYEVVFQFGAFAVSPDLSQTIQLEVRDEATNTLLASTIVADGTSSNDLSTLWGDYSLEFTASGTATIIEFTDLSTETRSVDGLLDNVSLVGGVPTLPPWAIAIGALLLLMTGVFGLRRMAG